MLPPAHSAREGPQTSKAAAVMTKAVSRSTLAEIIAS